MYGCRSPGTTVTCNACAKTPCKLQLTHFPPHVRGCAKQLLFLSPWCFPPQEGAQLLNPTAGFQARPTRPGPAVTAGSYPHIPGYTCNHPGLVWWCLEALKRNYAFPRDVVCPRAWPDMWCGNMAQLGSVGWPHRVEGAEMGIAPSLQSAGRTLGLNPGSCTRILSLGYLVHSLQESQGANQQKVHEALPARSLPVVCSQ